MSKNSERIFNLLLSTTFIFGGHSRLSHKWIDSKYVDAQAPKVFGIKFQKKIQCSRLRGKMMTNQNSLQTRHVYRHSVCCGAAPDIYQFYLIFLRAGNTQWNKIYPRVSYACLLTQWFGWVTLPWPWNTARGNKVNVHLGTCVISYNMCVYTEFPSASGPAESRRLKWRL